jgi:hypothetical protein
MAIDRIPGVGPANSDVASAVAAVVPNSAAITAAVPTAAQIATAVAAPSAATIAAAVAAPSAATIAAAVAAPSAATIASSVLSSGNSAGWGTTGGDTWTAITTGTVGGASAVNLTGLSGYKKYKLVMVQFDGSGNYSFRGYINSSTTGNTYSIGGIEGNQNSVTATWTAFGNNTLTFHQGNFQSVVYCELLIEAANLTGYKPISTKYMAYDGSGFPKYSEFYGGMSSTTGTINQIYVFRSSGTWTNGMYTLYGIN